MTNTEIRVSLVIPTFNRLQTLKQTLASIENLNFPMEELEVIVVDDGSTDGTFEWLQEVSKGYSCNLQALRQENAGPAAARNTGIFAAQGEFVALTDSDCILDSEWLHELLSGFGAPEIAGTGGVVRAVADDLISRYFAFTKAYDTRVIAGTSRAIYLLTLNACYRRDLLLQVGGFDPWFRPAGEDPDLCFRLRKKGFEFGYQPKAILEHHHRCTLRAFYRTFLVYGIGKALIEKNHGIWGDRRSLIQVLGLRSTFDFIRRCRNARLTWVESCQFSFLHYLQDIALYWSYKKTSRQIRRGKR